MEPNPNQPVMMGRQAHFVATFPAQKIIRFMACGGIVPDGFSMSDQSRFQPFVQIVIHAALVEIDMMLIYKIIKTSQSIFTGFDPEQLYFIIFESALDQLLVKVKQVI